MWKNHKLFFLSFGLIVKCSFFPPWGSSVMIEKEREETVLKGCPPSSCLCFQLGNSSRVFQGLPQFLFIRGWQTESVLKMHCCEEQITMTWNSRNSHDWAAFIYFCFASDYLTDSFFLRKRMPVFFVVCILVVISTLCKGKIVIFKSLLLVWGSYYSA